MGVPRHKELKIVQGKRMILSFDLVKSPDKLVYSGKIRLKGHGMKKTSSYWIIFIVVLGCVGFFSAAGIMAAAQDDPGAKLVGEWVVAGKHGTGDGEAVFKADMTYTLTETHPDGTGVTHKGEYRIDASGKPCAIDLCVGKFSNAGSEWVTTFGILRFLSDDEAEIHFDPSGKRPNSFEGLEPGNTHQMTRKK